jgi:predicted dehydrogenase
MSLRTAVIGVGSLGRQHARIHGALATEGRSQFVAVCDLNEQTALTVAEERKTEKTTDWRELIGRVDAVSLAVPTEAHCEIACGLLENGIHVLVEKPISRTLDEADLMIRAAEKGNALLQVGHLERFNPAMVALRPHVKKPVYFEIHRVGQFTARSLDIDVVLDLMIHDLDIVQWLVGEEVEVTNIHAVGIAILTNKVDAANARLEFSSGAVANITASRVGTEKIRKMRFFQPHDYVAIDYTTKRNQAGFGEQFGTAECERFVAGRAYQASRRRGRRAVARGNRFVFRFGRKRFAAGGLRFRWPQCAEPGVTHFGEDSRTC